MRSSAKSVAKISIKNWCFLWEVGFFFQIFFPHIHLYACCNTLFWSVHEDICVQENSLWFFKNVLYSVRGCMFFLMYSQRLRIVLGTIMFQSGIFGKMIWIFINGIFASLLMGFIQSSKVLMAFSFCWHKFLYFGLKGLWYPRLAKFALSFV